MVNFSIVIEKIMERTGLTSDKDVARALEISPQDFSNRKKRGTLLPVIVEWALREKVSIDWLLTEKERAEGGNEKIDQRPMDTVTEKIHQHLEQMCEDQKRDVLKYTEEKKLLSELMSERQRKAG